MQLRPSIMQQTVELRQTRSCQIQLAGFEHSPQTPIW